MKKDEKLRVPFRPASGLEIDVEAFDLGELVRFDLNFPTDPQALANDPHLRWLYDVYLKKVAAVVDFRERDKLKCDMLGLFQAISNFDEIVPQESEYRLVARHSLVVIALRSYALGAMSSSDEKADKRVNAMLSDMGRKGGKVKADRAANTWHSKATAQAKKMRDEFPGIPQRDLAERITDLWSCDGGGECPVKFHAMLKMVVRLERTGVIPRASLGGQRP